MAKNATENSTLQEIKELTQLFEQIKGDTEEFIERAVALSETGAHDAKDLIDAVKENWQKVVASFTGATGSAGSRGSQKSATSKKSAGKKVTKKTSGKKASSKSTTTKTSAGSKKKSKK